MVVCSICFNQTQKDYVVLDRKLAIFACSYCRASEEFNRIINDSNLTKPQKKNLRIYKENCDRVNKKIFKLINILEKCG